MVGGHHGECGARSYDGGLGAEPPAGSRGRASGQGVRGAKPPEAESILVIGCPTEPANLAPFHLFHLYFYSRCNGNDMGKILCRNPGGQVTPVAPSWGGGAHDSIVTVISATAAMHDIIHTGNKRLYMLSAIYCTAVVH